jgi:non-canonical (house-cleaning) NTP pyrophosphatase
MLKRGRKEAKRGHEKGRKNSQFMMTILIMVNVKKGRGAISILTKMAVRRNTTKITARLPMIRNF